MRGYRCNACGGICDPGELSGGICFDCRQESAKRAEHKAKEITRILSAVKEQADGQIALEVG